MPSTNTGSTLAHHRSPAVDPLGRRLDRGDQLGARPEREPGDRPVGVAQDALAVDHEHRPPVEADRTEDAVQLAHLLLGVAEQREGEPALVLAELVVARHRLGADRQHPGVERRELGDVLGVGVELAGAHGRVVARVEDQDDRAAPVLGQRVLAVPLRRAVGALEREVGGGAAHLDFSDKATTVSRMASGMSKLACTAWTSSCSSRASTSRSTFFADSVDSSGIVACGTIARSTDSTAMPASSRAVRTACRSDGGVVTRQASPSSVMSSAPASRAVSISSSSSVARATRMWPFRSNCQATAPGSAIEPPFFEKALRTSDPVRFRLSVSTSTSTATPPGA